MPHIDQLRPGDLVLSRAVKPGFVDSRIARAQQSNFSSGDARWTHAAIVIDGDFLVEALPRLGTVTGSVYTYLPDTIIRVRRIPSISDEVRLRLAIQALKRIGQRYSHFAAWSLGRDLIAGLWNKNVLSTNRFVVICSQIYLDSALDVLDLRLKGCPAVSPTTPAHLSATSSLLDIRVDWIKVG